MNERSRFEQRVQMQAMQIEQVFGRNQLNAHVTHGTASTREASYAVRGQSPTIWQRLATLKRELVSALRVEEVRVTPNSEGARVDVVQTPRSAAPLLSLLERFPSPAPLQATLGLGEEGQPVHLNLADTDARHALVVGSQGAGKSTLLTSLAMSLALHTPQSRLQMAILDTQPRKGMRGDLHPLNYVPHLMMPVVSDVNTAFDALQFLVEETQYRLRRRRRGPLIMVMIDRLELLLHRDAEQTRLALTQLLQHGDDAGLFVVLSTRSARSELLDNLVKSYLATRLVGQVADERDARAATGIRHSYVEQLLGRGEFVSVQQGAMAYFQGAHLAEHEMVWALQELDRTMRYRPRLLAHQFVVRPTLPPEPVTQVATSFVINADGEVETDAVADVPLAANAPPVSDRPPAATQPLSQPVPQPVAQAASRPVAQSVEQASGLIVDPWELVDEPLNVPPRNGVTRIHEPPEPAQKPPAPPVTKQRVARKPPARSSQPPRKSAPDSPSSRTGLKPRP